MSSQRKSAAADGVRVYLCGGCNRIHITLGSTSLSIDPLTFSSLYQQMSQLIDSGQQGIPGFQRTAIPKGQRH